MEECKEEQGVGVGVYSRRESEEGIDNHIKTLKSKRARKVFLLSKEYKGFLIV